jgi:hypothetical protein
MARTQTTTSREFPVGTLAALAASLRLRRSRRAVELIRELAGEERLYRGTRRTVRGTRWVL